jgi:hypothetical protein
LSVIPFYTKQIRKIHSVRKTITHGNSTRESYVVEDTVVDTIEEDSILEVEDPEEDIRDTHWVVVEAENSLVEGEVDNNRL